MMASVDLFDPIPLMATDSLIFDFTERNQADSFWFGKSLESHPLRIICSIFFVQLLMASFMILSLFSFSESSKHLKIHQKPLPNV